MINFATWIRSMKMPRLGNNQKLKMHGSSIMTNPIKGYSIEKKRDVISKR